MSNYTLRCTPAWLLSNCPPLVANYTVNCLAGGRQLRPAVPGCVVGKFTPAIRFAEDALWPVRKLIFFLTRELAAGSVERVMGATRPRRSRRLSARRNKNRQCRHSPALCVRVHVCVWVRVRVFVRLRPGESSNRAQSASPSIRNRTQTDGFKSRSSRSLLPWRLPVLSPSQFDGGEDVTWNCATLSI